jgi:hypothetical protein
VRSRANGDSHRVRGLRGARQVRLNSQGRFRSPGPIASSSLMGSQVHRLRVSLSGRYGSVRGLRAGAHMSKVNRQGEPRSGSWPNLTGRVRFSVVVVRWSRFGGRGSGGGGISKGDARGPGTAILVKGPGDAFLYLTLRF